MEVLRILAANGKEALEHTIENDIPTGELDIWKVLPYVYSILGIVAVIGIIFGAVVWTTSQGDPAKVKKGKDAVLYAVIGLAVVLLAATMTVIISGAVKG